VSVFVVVGIFYDLTHLIGHVSSNCLCELTFTAKLFNIQFQKHIIARSTQPSEFVYSLFTVNVCRWYHILYILGVCELKCCQIFCVQIIFAKLQHVFTMSNVSMLTQFKSYATCQWCLLFIQFFVES